MGLHIANPPTIVIQKIRNDRLTGSLLYKLHWAFYYKEGRMVSTPQENKVKGLHIANPPTIVIQKIRNDRLTGSLLYKLHWAFYYKEGRMVRTPQENKVKGH
jgi:hypothetical protein